jgi:hypothetical protein
LEGGRLPRRWGWLEGGFGALVAVNMGGLVRGRGATVVELGEKTTMVVAREGRMRPPWAH